MKKEEQSFVWLLLGLMVAMIAAFAGTTEAGRYDYSYPRSTVHQIFVGDNKTSAASGVMIAPLLMLTAAHVAAVPNITVGAQHATVKVLRIDTEKDLALLLVAMQCPCASIAKTTPDVDDAVISIGYPINELMVRQMLTEGRYQGDSDKSFASITSPVAPGNSGGGVFVWEGTHWSLAGVISGIAVAPLYGMPSFLPHLVRAASTKSIQEFMATRSPAELAGIG